MKVKYDMALMKLMGLFESLTHVALKDCYEDAGSGNLTFIVAEGSVGKAVGKGACNVKRIEGMLNKRVRIVEYSADLCQFVRNMIMPLRVADVSVSDKVVTIRDSDMQTKGLIIGRNAQNLRALEEHVKRHFDIE